MIEATHEIRRDNVKNILTEHKVMWDEMQEVHRDFWTARDKFYKYLTSNDFMAEEDFHIYKMVLFEDFKGEQ